MSGSTNTKENINYTYLCVATILLIISYYLLHTLKKEHKEKEKRESSSKNTILVQTSKGEIKMDANIFEIHMNRMKGNIISLSENMSGSKCSVIKKYLETTKQNTKSFIELNHNNKDFCKMDIQYKMVNPQILKERELLRKKMLKETVLETDESKEADKMRYSILELLIDIDIILFLVRASLCKTGKVDLSVMDSFLIELYRINCDNQETQMDGKMIDPPQDTFVDGGDIDNNHTRDINNSRNIDTSQIISDKTSLSQKNKNQHQKNQKHTRRFVDVLSHSNNKGFNSNIITAGSMVKGPNRSIDYNIDPRNPLIDTGSRSSLGETSR